MPVPKISRRDLAEAILQGVTFASSPFIRKTPTEPKSIFVLRNNGLGDLLCATPLFEMLKLKYPNAEIIAGIGNWHEQLLDRNPYLSRCIKINAPWHNQFVVAPNILRILAYLLFSGESKALYAMKLDVGFDVVGSLWGSMLLLRCGIPLRIGVKGYAGGHSATNLHVEYDDNMHVSQAAIEMGKLLGIRKNPSLRPQIYLSDREIFDAELIWKQSSKQIRILIAPGGSFEEKRWGDLRFAKLIQLILEKTNHQICLIGGTEDRKRVPIEQSNDHRDRVNNLCGKLNLRESAAMVHAADFVISNSSVAMHFAGAFSKPSLVLLGNCYESAKQHSLQWGYSDSVVLGKEVKAGIKQVPSPVEVFKTFLNLLAQHKKVLK